MDQAKSLETGGCGSEAVKSGNQDIFVRADNDKGNLPSPADEDGNLPVYFMGKKRKLSGQILRNDPFRRRPTAIELLQPPDLLRSETDQITIDFVDGRPPYFS